VQQSSGEVVEGALAAMTPVAFASGTVLVRAPAANVMALAPRTLEWTIFPPERMNVGLALFSVENLVQIDLLYAPFLCDTTHYSINHFRGASCLARPSPGGEKMTAVWVSRHEVLVTP